MKRRFFLSSVLFLLSVLFGLFAITIKASTVAVK